jgi:cobalt/nickel transport protein
MEANRTDQKKIIAAGILLALVVAGLLSPWASSWPDGLERVAENLGFLNKAEGPAGPVWEKSPLPDYKVPGVRDERWATGLAGVAGTLAIAAIAWGLARLLKKRGS